MACPHQHQTAPPPRPVPSANRTAPPCPPALPPETRRSARSRTPAVSSKFSSHPEGPAPPLNQASPVGHPAQQPSRPALPLPLAPQHVSMDSQLVRTANGDVLVLSGAEEEDARVEE